MIPPGSSNDDNNNNNNDDDNDEDIVVKYINNATMNAPTTKPKSTTPSRHPITFMSCVRLPTL